MLTFAAETDLNPADLWWLLVLLITILVIGLTFMAAVGRLLRRLYFNPDDRDATEGSKSSLDPWSEAARRYRDDDPSEESDIGEAPNPDDSSDPGRD